MTESSTLTIKVRPNAPETKIVSQAPLKIDVAAPPDKNKANRELVRFLSKHFNADVKVISGAASRLKKVRITAKE